MDWAYITCGKVKGGEDVWNLFQPRIDETCANVQAIFTKIANGIYAQADLARKRDEIISIVGFDGQNFYTGSSTKVKSLLPDNMVGDTSWYMDKTDKRPITWMHGFASEVSNGKIPEQIPHLNIDELKQLHVENVIPIWNDTSDKVTQTIFGQPEQLKAVADILPQEILKNCNMPQKMALRYC